MLREATSYRVP